VLGTFKYTYCITLTCLIVIVITAIGTVSNDWQNIKSDKSRSIAEHFLDYSIIPGRFRRSNATVSFFSPISHVNEFVYVKAFAGKGRKSPISLDEKRRAWRDAASDGFAIWYDFYLRLDNPLDRRLKFRLRWFHVRIDPIYARLIFPVREDSVAVVPPRVSVTDWF